ncbi:MAG: metal-sensitive transcriptional regulator [Nitrososphaerota archaeon]|nr:metal-sensitive transcriptional regulator [Nitrososphaerota archaeon]
MGHTYAPARPGEGIYRYPIPLEGMSNHRRKDVSRRIARIHGHVHGIAGMLDEGKPYSEIVHQVAAVRSSLDSVIQVIVDDLVEGCLVEVKGKTGASSLEELQKVVAAIT